MSTDYKNYDRRALIGMNKNQGDTIAALRESVRKLSSDNAMLAGVAQAAEQARIKSEAAYSDRDRKMQESSDRMYQVANACLRISAGRGLSSYED